MKKVKIMLMAIAVLAVVGGALAFKANFNETFCTMNPIEDPTTAVGDVCPVVDALKITTLNAFPAWIADPDFVETYTTVENGPEFCLPEDCDFPTLVAAD
jgi:hypothetical protein